MSTLVQPAPQKLKTPTLPKGDDCLVVIFGGTGDLTHRKLIPALYDLACVGCTTRNLKILGVGRTKLNDEEYRGRLHDGTKTSKDTRNFSEDGWKEFTERVHYFIGDASKPEFYPELKKKIVDMQKAGASKNVLFYVSTSASLAPPIVDGLGEVGLASNGEGWTRIILEKPFGSDLETARELNEMVSHVFPRSRSIASTITSAKRRCRTSWSSASATRCLSRCGTAITSSTWRLRQPRQLGVESRGGVLRRDRRAARHGRQSLAPVADAHGDGAAGGVRCRLRARRRRCRCCARFIP